MSTMGSTKSQGKGRLLMCFKPTFDDHDDGPASSFSSGDESSGGRSKKRARRSFYVAVKAVLFSTSLLKNEDPNNKKYMYLTSKSKRFVKSMKKLSYKSCWEPGQEIDIQTDSSNSSLLLSDSTRHTGTPSTLSSSSSLSSVSVKLESDRIGTSDSIDFENSSNRQKSMKREWAKKWVQNYNSTLEMSLFVVCLVALIFGGKAFAILICTLMLLLFAPRRRSRRSRKVEWTV